MATDGVEIVGTPSAFLIVGKPIVATDSGVLAVGVAILAALAAVATEGVPKVPTVCAVTFTGVTISVSPIAPKTKGASVLAAETEGISAGSTIGNIGFGIGEFALLLTTVFDMLTVGMLSSVRV